jgi:hypothetical protein
MTLHSAETGGLGGRPGLETSRPCVAFPPICVPAHVFSGQGRTLRFGATESGAFPAAQFHSDPASAGALAGIHPGRLPDLARGELSPGPRRFFRAGGV